MIKTLIYFVRHPENAIQSCKSLSHWWPCISSYTSACTVNMVEIILWVDHLQRSLNLALR